MGQENEKQQGIDTICMITHAVHMRRAARSFERARLNVIPTPTYFYSAPDSTFITIS